MSYLGPTATEGYCDSKSNISPGGHRILGEEWTVTSSAAEPESAGL